MIATMARAMPEKTRPIRPTLAEGLSRVGVCIVPGVSIRN
jgi:hypothetical protein